MMLGLSLEISLLAAVLCATAISCLKDGGSPQVFSFKYHKISQSDASLTAKYFVAFDGYSGVFRRDLMNIEDWRKNHSITIADFRNNRRYNIRQRLQKTNDGRLEPDPTGVRSCLASYVNPLASLNKEEEPTLPIEKLNGQGSEEVRGVTTKVFEQTTTSLPSLFFPSLWYLDHSGEQYLKKNDVKPETTWILKYFFAPPAKSDQEVSSEEGSELEGSLVRVDVIQGEVVVYRIEVFDFAWSLRPPVNGEQHNELFALKYMCLDPSSTTETDRLADLEMDLEYSSKELPALEAYEYIHLPAIRRQTLRRALITNNNLLATGLYDLESRIEPVDETRLMLHASAKLIDSSGLLPLNEPRVFGHGTPTEHREKAPVTSSDDCFWEALHMSKTIQRPVLFAFCLRACIIDPNPMTAEDSKRPNHLIITGSNGFTLDEHKQQPCQIFSLDQVETIDHFTKNKATTTRSLWNSIFSNLYNRQLSLDLASRQGKSPNKLLFDVKRIKLSNDTWLLDDVEWSQMKKSGSSLGTTLLIFLLILSATGGIWMVTTNQRAKLTEVWKKKQITISQPMRSL